MFLQYHYSVITCILRTVFGYYADDTYFYVAVSLIDLSPLICIIFVVIDP